MFRSEIKLKKQVKLPEFTGLRVLMMPLILHDMNSIPEMLNDYKPLIKELFSMTDCSSDTCYITIDEMELKQGEYHRRSGLHVDGVYSGGHGSWGGGYESEGNGMLVVSNIFGCKAYKSDCVYGDIGKEGDVKIAWRITEYEEILLKENVVYWMDGLCVHESIPMQNDCKRQFIRLSLPSEGAWFEGYTENPIGIKPKEIIEGNLRKNFIDE